MESRLSGWGMRVCTGLQGVGDIIIMGVEDGPADARTGN